MWTHGTSSLVDYFGKKKRKLEGKIRFAFFRIEIFLGKLNLLPLKKKERGKMICFIDATY